MKSIVIIMSGNEAVMNIKSKPMYFNFCLVLCCGTLYKILTVPEPVIPDAGAKHCMPVFKKCILLCTRRVNMYTFFIVTLKSEDG